MLIGLTWAQYNTGEVWTVRSIGEVLCLKAYSRTIGECAAVSTLITRCEVGSVELHTRLGSKALEGTAALRLGNLRCKAHLTFLALVQHIVVIVAMTELNLLIISIDLLSEGLGLTEIKRRTFNLQDFACRNGGVVGRQIEIGIDFAV